MCADKLVHGPVALNGHRTPDADQDRQRRLARPWNDPAADVTRALASPTSTVLAALDEAGRLLGTAMVGHDGHRGWVYYLAVDPDLRGNGLGRQLMHASERWLRERDVPKLNLMVRTTNHAVLATRRARLQGRGGRRTRQVPRRGSGSHWRLRCVGSRMIALLRIRREVGLRGPSAQPSFNTKDSDQRARTGPRGPRGPADGCWLRGGAGGLGAVPSGLVAANCGRGSCDRRDRDRRPRALGGGVGTRAHG